MSHSLHTISYKDLFSGHKVGMPLQLKIPQTKRLIIISDCHLNAHFDEQRYLLLKKIIKRADVLIINGDFWEDSSISFKNFMKSRWTALFPDLKKKGTYYVFGNHDMPLNSDERISEFSAWAGFRMKIKAGKILLHVEHGHLVSGNFERAMWATFQKHPYVLKFVTLPLAAVEETTRFVVEKIGSEVLKRLNTDFKTSRHAVSLKQEYFVMGHTHVPEFDEKTRYINSGLTHKGHFDYVEVYKNKIAVISL